MSQGRDKEYLEHDPELTVGYEELISDLLLRTTRPAKTLLSAAAAAVRAWQSLKPVKLTCGHKGCPRL